MAITLREGRRLLVRVVEPGRGSRFTERFPELAEAEGRAA
jgi:hypothetical protein